MPRSVSTETVMISSDCFGSLVDLYSFAPLACSLHVAPADCDRLQIDLLDAQRVGLLRPAKSKCELEQVNQSVD